MIRTTNPERFELRFHGGGSSTTLPFSMVEAAELGAWLTAQAYAVQAQMEDEIRQLREPERLAAEVLAALDPPEQRAHPPAQMVVAGVGGGGGGAGMLQGRAGPIYGGGGGSGTGSTSR